jgi:N-acetylneuraminate synthase/N,N'-diacetyllegionaminate synthase
MSDFQIRGRVIGAGHPCFIIAEAGVNHNGDIELARKLIDVAVESGADAIKFQTFKTENFISTITPKANYQRTNTGDEGSMLDMVRQLELSYDAFRELSVYSEARGILFLSTPFDEISADFLASLNIPCFKVASGEINNFPFLEHIARKQLPMIVSTGMSYMEEIAEALQVIRTTGNNQIALLHCVSNYPADPSDVNLRAMQTMQTEFGLPTGFSDHTLGIEIALAAVSMGAGIIEKHFTLDKKLPGPDHVASLEPSELKTMIRSIRMIESALGDGIKRPVASEANTREVARRSVVAAQFIPAGTILTREMLAIKRPATGFPPRMLNALIGAAAVRDIQSDEPITTDHVGGVALA